MNTLHIEELGSVAIITLNREEVFNSFNRKMGEEFMEILTRCGSRDDIRAVLITGKGKAFCAGQDLAEAAPDGEPVDNIDEIVREVYNPVIKLIRALPKPVICAVNGVAAGAGANIALSCDMVLASEEAYFMQAFVNIGLIPDSGGTWFLPRLAGFARASAMMMTGDKTSAEEAFNYGMIYKVCKSEELFDDAFNLAVKLSQKPTKAIGKIKEALNKSYFNKLEDQLDLEEKLQGEAGKTEDYREGVKSFLEKRKSQFKGK